MIEHHQNPARIGYQLPVIILCSILLLLPAILNRAPFVYFDSAAYLTQAGKAVHMLQRGLGIAPEVSKDAGLASEIVPKIHSESNNITYAGRSIYYSFFAWTGAETVGLAAVAALQALALAILIVMAVQTVLPAASTMSFMMVAGSLSGGLALLTSAGFFVSLIMPDIWTGMMILAFALLMSQSPSIGRSSRFALFTIITLAALFHTSHLLILTAMIGVLALVMRLPSYSQMMAPRRLVLPALAVILALAGNTVFSAAITAITGHAPLTRPFITAHLVEMGPGTRLIQRTCPNNGFAICPFVERLPTDWISFLFSKDAQTGVFAMAPSEIQRAISAEQARFAIATLAAEPLATTGGLIRDGITQLWQLSVDDVPLSLNNEAFVAGNFTPQVAATIRGSTIWGHPWLAPALSKLIQVGTALSAIGLLVMALYSRVPRHGPIATVLLVCLLGVVLNALICGMLASPYGRFQARVSWLLPLVLVLTILHVRFPAFANFKKSYL